MALTSYIIRNKFFLISTLLFGSYLLYFHYEFLRLDLGVLTFYVSDFNALNELSFWGALINTSYQDILFSNPIKYNFVAISLFSFSKFFSNSAIFTVFPILFTSASFYLILKILAFYRLDKVWSVILAFLGLTSISSLPLFTILSSSILMQEVNIGPGYFDLLTSYSTSLLMLSFLILFYVTLVFQSIKSNRYTFLIALIWGFSIFFHPSIFIFGYSFWFFSNLIKEIRLRVNGSNFNLGRLLIFSLIPLIIAIPYLLLNIEFYSESAGFSEELFKKSLLTNLIKPLSFYFILPLFLFLLSSNIFKVDPYESLVRFWPILLISVIELIIRALNYFGLLALDTEIILNRISVYFLHFFYYVPFLSIISRKFSYLPIINETSKNLSYYLRILMSFFGRSLRVPLGLILFFLVSVYSQLTIEKINSSYIDNHARQIKTDLKEIKSNPLFSGKDFIFSSVDNNLVASFQGLTKTNLNTFLSYGSSFDEDFQEYNFLNSLLLEEGYKLSSFSVEGILVKDEFSNYFKNFNRQIALLSWLRFNQNQIQYQLEGNKSVPVKEDFLNSYIIISDKEYSLLERLNLEKIQSNNRFIYYKK